MSLAYPQDALPSGTRLYGFQIEGLLGRGGFGVTYRATDLLGQSFAVKEFFPRQFARRSGAEVVAILQSDTELLEDCRQRFLREARLLAELGREGGEGGIVRVVTYFEANNTAYSVMEMVSGETLDDRIRREAGGIPIADLLNILRGILASLARVHAASILHRDIKPSNIILRADGSPVLIDFGAARDFGGNAQTTYTQIFSGGYAPIEQVVGSRQGTFSDIYSVGAVGYRAIGGTLVGSLERHQALLANAPDPLPPAAEVGRGRYPVWLLAGIDTALAIAAGSRPQTAGDLQTLLAEPKPVVRNLSSPADATTTPTPRAAVEREAFRPAMASGRPNDTGTNRRLDDDARWTPRHLQHLSGDASPLAHTSQRSRLLRFARERLQPIIAVGVCVFLFWLVLYLLPHPLHDTRSDSARLVGVNPAQLFSLGQEAVQRGEFGQAVALLQKATDVHDPRAPLALSELYQSGQGVAANPDHAFNLALLSAQRGDPSAMAAVAERYREGQGVGRDLKQAFHWDFSAARAGANVQQPLAALFPKYKTLGETDADVAFGLAQSYKEGVGVDRDTAAFQNWMETAAILGNEQARQWSLTRDRSDQMAEAARASSNHSYQLAALIWQKQAEGGNASAAYELGKLFLEGKLGQPDAVKALVWMLRAANGGDRDAQTAAADLLLAGTKGVKRNVAQAEAWYAQAAQAGATSARMPLLTLASCRAANTDQATQERALADLQKIASTDRDGAYAVATLYLAGHFCIQRDVDKARKWMVIASNLGNPAAHAWLEANSVPKSLSLAQFGPSFDCAKAQRPLELIICSDPALARTDFHFVQAYEALAHQVGDSGAWGLKKEAIDFGNLVLRDCGVAASGPAPDKSESLDACIAQHYESQRNAWIARLRPPASEEAAHEGDRQILLQRRLQQLGFLDQSAAIDGVYGAMTRTAIASWQRSRGLAETGFLGDHDAELLLAHSQTEPSPSAPASVARPVISPEGTLGPPATPLIEGATQWGAGSHVALNRTIPFAIVGGGGNVVCSGNVQVRVVQRNPRVYAPVFEYLVRDTSGPGTVDQVQLPAEGPNVASGATVMPQGEKAKRQSAIWNAVNEPIRFDFRPGVSCANNDWSPVMEVFTRQNTTFSENLIRIRVSTGLEVSVMAPTPSLGPSISSPLSAKSAQQ